jgi:protein ImuA
LRERIRVLERVPVSLAVPPAPDAGPWPRPACSFSSHPAPAAFRHEPANATPSPWGRLEAAGLHEIKASAYRDQPAALAFALAAIGNRLARREAASSPLLWCLTERAAREWGGPYGPGLLAFGLDPALFLIVQTRTAVDAAWALEEGLKAQAFAAALGQIEVKAPLFARRLGLAAQASRTPCLLLSGHRAGALPGTLTRWRVETTASGGAVFDASAPGSPSWRLTLERCRGIGAKRSWVVEFRHGAYGVRLAAASADRAATAGEQDQALVG